MPVQIVGVLLLSSGCSHPGMSHDHAGAIARVQDRRAGIIQWSWICAIHPVRAIPDLGPPVNRRLLVSRITNAVSIRIGGSRRSLNDVIIEKVIRIIIRSGGSGRIIRWRRIRHDISGLHEHRRKVAIMFGAAARWRAYACSQSDQASNARHRQSRFHDAWSPSSRRPFTSAAGAFSSVPFIFILAEYRLQTPLPTAKTWAEKGGLACRALRACLGRAAIPGHGLDGFARSFGNGPHGALVLAGDYAGSGLTPGPRRVKSGRRLKRSL